MLQKTYTEDYMTGKKIKNIGQRGRYYVSNSHPAIVSVGVFDRAQEEMNKRSRLVYKEDGTVESRERKYNGKYLLGNLFVCGYCGASYRRRTERGKVVWRCATRVEKGKERCFDSPTLKEEWIKEVLEKVTCENNVYSEEMVGSKVEKIVIFNEYLGVCCKDKDKISIKLISSR